MARTHLYRPQINETTSLHTTGVDFSIGEYIIQDIVNKYQKGGAITYLSIQSWEGGGPIWINTFGGGPSASGCTVDPEKEVRRKRGSPEKDVRFKKFEILSLSIL